MKKLIKISERVYMYKYERKTDRPNLYYIKGDKYGVCVDAGTSMNHLYGFYRAIMDMDFTLPKYTIITHWHWDHSFALPYISGKSISSKMTHDILLDVEKWEWNLEEMKKRVDSKIDIPFCDKCIKNEYKNLSNIKVVTTDIAIKKKRMDLGGVILNLSTMDSPHSRDSLIIDCPQERVLFIGDADCGDDYCLSGGYDISRTKKLLKFIKNRQPEIILPGHCLPIKYSDEIDYLEGVIMKQGKVKNKC